jgi:mediator of RNA polymerase II transcription subunit 7
MATSAYPPPPPFYRLYKDYEQDPSSAPEPPPPPPVDKIYTTFGAERKVCCLFTFRATLLLVALL